ncbi:MAG TPA: divalent-cation tolerance protein CutA [Planctomycetota bacterium]|nr:divalent-cation tolerance protein CutA [Planctomycetota bacterium]
MSDVIQVSTTTGTRDDAQRIADALVEKRLAACVQVVGPVTSTYRWQGNVERTTEWLCLIKTTAALYGEVESAIRELHPYEVPEIIAVPVAAGSRDYLEWLKGSVRS